MMGERQVEQAQLFYEFNLERHVPTDHLLRSIDRFVDFDELRARLASYYSSTGRPSVDLELLIRMLIIGYCYGIRSERRLCEEVHLNLAFRWFCRLGLEGQVPEPSTFSKNRHGRFRDSDLLRQLFEGVLRRCRQEGLVGGEGFAVDASLVAADASPYTRLPGTAHLPSDAIGRAVREYLAVLDDAAFGAATPITPKYFSPTDPAARWTAAHRGPAFFAYAINYLVDLAHAVIVNVEATTAVRQAEVSAAQTMLERAQVRLGLTPARLVADMAYGSAAMLGWLVGQAIAPFIPVLDKAARADSTLARDAFAYDAEHDIYLCPHGKPLSSSGRLVNDGATLIYLARTADCAACPAKPRCCPNTPMRKVPRSLHEGARDLARRLRATEAYRTSRRERKKVEMLFAHLKRMLKLHRLRLRGPSGAHDDFLLAAIAQNLRRLAKLIPMPHPA